jgi:hypothetical protein
VARWHGALRAHPQKAGVLGIRSFYGLNEAFQFRVIEGHVCRETLINGLDEAVDVTALVGVHDDQTVTVVLFSEGARFAGTAPTTFTITRLVRTGQPKNLHRIPSLSPEQPGFVIG